MSSTIKKVLALCIILLISLATITLAAAVYTSRSEFCTSCHYMIPFYESWKASKHHKVDCIQCHFSPGIKSTIRGKMEGLVQLVNYVSLSYKKSRPWAEIPDESCLRPGCHETRLIEGEFQFMEGIVFNHKPHLTEMRRGKKLRCTSCHSHVVQGSHMKVDKSTCYICHMKKAEGAVRPPGACVTCHSKSVLLKNSRAGLMRYDHIPVVEHDLDCANCHTNTVIGNAPVYKESCFSCHFETDKLDKYKDTTFMHTTHITDHKIECLNCHLPIEHKVTRGDIKVASNCDTCHPKHHLPQKILFSGHGGVGSPDQPNKMFDMGLNCRGCHISHEMSPKNLSGKTYRAMQEACDRCHGKGFGTLIDQWGKEVEQKLSELESMRKKARGEIESRLKQGEKRKKADALIDEVSFNMDVVEQGRCVHNIRYALDLLRASHGILQEALTLAGSEYELPPFTQGAKKLYADCLTCHFEMEKVMPAFAGLVFSHKNHLGRGLVCSRCHSIARRHGELVIRKNECAACHHTETMDKDCTACHALQNDIFYGERTFPHTQNIMAEAIECGECHEDIREGKRPNKETCLNCHDEGYDAIMVEWQDATKTTLEEMRNDIDDLIAQRLTQGNKAKVMEIETFVRAVEDDGSLGVHNPEAIGELAETYKQELEAIKKGSN